MKMTDTPPLPTTPDALMASLSAMEIPFVLHHHAPIFTVADGTGLKAGIGGVHIKNLFVRDKSDRMALIVLPGEITLDLKAVAPAIGLGRLSFGSPERLWRYLGVTPGSVCPFAAVNDTQGLVKVVLHDAVATAAMLTAHPMINTMSVSLSGKDLVSYLVAAQHHPQILDLSAYALHKQLE